MKLFGSFVPDGKFSVWRFKVLRQVWSAIIINNAIVKPNVSLMVDLISW